MLNINLIDNCVYGTVGTMVLRTTYIQITETEPSFCFLLELLSAEMTTNCMWTMT